MRIPITAALFVVLLIQGGCVSRHDLAKEPYDLYLLIGQSNMAGRDTAEKIDQTAHKRVLMLDEHGIWITATEPMHFDKPAVAGVGPGLAFAKVMASHEPQRTIGLIPAAVGGSSIETWVPGGFHSQTGSQPYDDAIVRARIAMRSGSLKAVLWHQGESDTSLEGASQYGEALAKLVHQLRQDLDAPALIFIAGELGHYLEDAHPGSLTINAALRDSTHSISNFGLVSADGLNHMGDGTHFNAESARKLGERYAATLIELRSVAP